MISVTLDVLIAPLFTLVARIFARALPLYGLFWLVAACHSARHWSVGVANPVQMSCSPRKFSLLDLRNSSIYRSLVEVATNIRAYMPLDCALVSRNVSRIGWGRRVVVRRVGP